MLFSALLNAQSQTIQSPASEAQRHREMDEEVERQRLLHAPKVDLQPEAPVVDRDRNTTQGTVNLHTVPEEKPCFTINQFVLSVPKDLQQSYKLAGTSQLQTDPFRFAQDYLEQYRGSCVGPNGIKLIAARLSSIILQKGYSTTRLGIPEQDLSQGVLTLTLVPGLIHSIRLMDAETDSAPASDATHQSGNGSMHLNAFPGGAGQLLNLRDLEQGLEQLKRVPSQDVDMKIVPSDVAGESDVLLSVTHTRPWKLSGTLDDSGARSTGKLQAGINLAIDNPFGLSDLFNIGINTNAENQYGSNGTIGNSAYYSVPSGDWTYSLSVSDYDYSQ